VLAAFLHTLSAAGLRFLPGLAALLKYSTGRAELSLLKCFCNLTVTYRGYRARRMAFLYPAGGDLHNTEPDA